jgi:hypothetical protein
MSAASRAITPQARERRLQLANIFVDRLKALNAPSPFEGDSAAFSWSVARHG